MLTLGQDSIELDSAQTQNQKALNPKEFAALTEQRQQMDIDRNNQEILVNKAGVSLSKPNP